MTRIQELHVHIVAGHLCEVAGLDDETPTDLGTPGRVATAFVRAVSLGVATIDDILGLVDLAPEHQAAAIKRMAGALALADLWVAGGAMEVQP